MFLKRLIKDLISFLPKEKGIPVLMYHSIDNNEVFFTVKPEEFKRQMDYLKNNGYRVIKFSDLVNVLEFEREIPKKTVVLTFDDGYGDNCINAFPILKKYNFPATIFLITGLIGDKINNAQNITLKALNWEQIKEMHNSGLIDFEPHTVNHEKITEKEIIDSKKEIEEKLNKKCYFFAYPKGKYDNNAMKILKENGFKAARTVKKGKVKKGDNLFKLKTISVNSTTSFRQFKSNL